jgi:ATP-dependent Clp protease ATP-binding subunit ClpB
VCFLLAKKGYLVSFRNTIIVATTNLGARHLAALPPNATAEAARPSVMHEIRAHFSPELLNRFDEVVLFNRLLPEHMLPIVQREVADLQCPCALRVSDALLQHLAQQAYDPSFGARPVRRTVQRLLLEPLALLLQNSPPTGPKETILADLDHQGKVVVHYQ